MKEIDKTNQSFEDIKHIDENSVEFWYARELMSILQYSNWQNFEKIIDKAKISCKNSDIAVTDHFIDTNKMVQIGSGAYREQIDFKLTRYACYLIAQNGDNRKKVIALAQTYFAVQTRKQEISEKEYSLLTEDEKRFYQRNLTKKGNYSLNQTAGMRKLLFHLESIEAEREIVKMGITTFIYRDDIEEYIDNIAKDTVKIIELENYEREIPDEIVAIIEQVKDKFDQLYILFTDYTGKVERQVEKERRQKDPILFGTFQNERTKTVIDRFYFLGDWEDEYCDLTLDKMVNEVESSKKRNIVRTVNTPEDIEELKKQLNQLVPTNDVFRIDQSKKKGVFKKIRSFLNGDKK